MKTLMISESKAKQQLQAYEHMKNMNRLTHHVRNCKTCQDYLIDTIADNQSTTADVMWRHIQAHATVMQQLGRV